MEYYERDSSDTDDEVTRLKKILIDEKNHIIEANEILQERGQKIEIIVQKAEHLNSESASFYKGAKKVYQNENKKRILYGIGLFVVILIIAYIIVGLTCSWTFQC